MTWKNKSKVYKDEDINAVFYDTGFRLICPGCHTRSVPNLWGRPLGFKIAECESCGKLVEVSWYAGKIYRRIADQMSFKILKKKLRQETKGEFGEGND